MNKQETMEELTQIIGEFLDMEMKPAIATAIAEAIDAKYLRIDRAELPDVTEEPDRDYFMAGWIVVAVDSDPGTCRRMALDYLAAAEHLEQRDTEEAKREERRRDIYVSLGGNEEDWAYVGKWSNMAAAVERIRVLEDGTP